MTVTYPTPGVYTPSATIFKTDGPKGRPAADIDAQVKHTIFLADNGVTGVVLLGSTGEMVHMTKKERFDFVAGVKKGLDAKGYKDYPVLAGVAHHGIDDTLEEIKSMKEAGAKWAMVLAPNYFASSTTQQGLINWFTAVADESVLPVVIYYFPGVSNNLKMTPETFEVLAQHPKICGAKLSHGNVTDYAQIALNPKVQEADFTTMTGLGQLLLPAMAVGCHGTIDACSGVFPKLLVKLWTLSKEGKIQEAQKLQYVVSRVEEIVAANGPMGVKHLMDKVLGYSSDLGRAPLNVALSDAQKETYAQAIADAVKLENSL